MSVTFSEPFNAHGASSALPIRKLWKITPWIALVCANFSARQVRDFQGAPTASGMSSFSAITILGQYTLFLYFFNIFIWSFLNLLM